MNGSRIQLEGLREFREVLRLLPETLAHEAGGIVQAHATEATQAIQAAYPVGPDQRTTRGVRKGGTLRRGVTLKQDVSRFGIGAIIRSGAKHAWIFEHGSAPRTTKKGQNRGVMPQARASQQMIPIVVRTRGRLMAALIELVKRAGFTVQVGS